jgi:hypothetical protein
MRMKIVVNRDFSINATNRWVARQDDTGPIIAVLHIPCIITDTIRFDVLQGTGLALRNMRFDVGGGRQSSGQQEAGD